MRDGWKLTTLGNVCSLDKKQGIHHKLPYVGMEHIESHTARFIGSLQPQAVKSSTFRFSSQHVLYGRLRPYLNKAFAPDFSGHCSTEIFPIKPNPSVTRNFLLYWLLAGENCDRINSTCTGTRMPRANMHEVLTFAFPLPPLAEQRRIVGVLDEAFAGIAKAKANAEQNRQNARAVFDSHLNQVFTQRGKGWVEKPLGQICENLDSKRVPITKSKRIAGKYPYYGASGIVDHVNDYIFDEDLLLVSEDGANLLARTYPIAFSVSGKVWVNNHAHVLRFPDLETQHFVEFYLNSIGLSEYVSGMAQPKLNQKSLNTIPVPVPSLTEQRHIVGTLAAISRESKQLASIYESKLTALEALKQSLLHEAFSGKL